MQEIFWKAIVQIGGLEAVPADREARDVPGQQQSSVELAVLPERVIGHSLRAAEQVGESGRTRALATRHEHCVAEVVEICQKLSAR